MPDYAALLAKKDWEFTYMYRLSTPTGRNQRHECTCTKSIASWIFNFLIFVVILALLPFLHYKDNFLFVW